MQKMVEQQPSGSNSSQFPHVRGVSAQPFSLTMWNWWGSVFGMHFVFNSFPASRMRGLFGPGRADSYQAGEKLVRAAFFGLNLAMRNFLRIVVTLLLLSLFFASFPAQAEYGDVIMNKRSDIQGVRPVIFSHTFHRIRFRCMVCHAQLGFKMRAGGNDVLMADIVDGNYCGACHNGTVAWGPEHCNLCHSGLPGLKKGVVGGHQTLGPGFW